MLRLQFEDPSDAELDADEAQMKVRRRTVAGGAVPSISSCLILLVACLFMSACNIFSVSSDAL